MMKSGLFFVAACVLLSALSGSAWAHRPSESHITLKPLTAASEGRIDVAFRDIDAALALDSDGNGSLTWAEVTSRESEVNAYITKGMQLRADNGPCPVQMGHAQMVVHSDGPYLSLPFNAGCPPHARSIELQYSLFFDLDPQHRALVRVDDGTDKTFIVSKSNPHASLTVGRGSQDGTMMVIGSFVRHGVQHIAEGFDHLLFLLLLLLPAVLRRDPDKQGQWVPMQALRPTLLEVVKIATAFTTAHALTMSAAALGLVTVPSSLVEPAIALSLVIAAANNVWPIFAGGRWALPFVLGLLHGFGFSSALADLGLPANRIAPALFGFNVGVELGQLAMVVVVVPVAFLLRRTRGYRNLAITGGSLAIAAVALVWFVERVLAVSFI